MHPMRGLLERILTCGGITGSYLQGTRSDEYGTIIPIITGMRCTRLVAPLVRPLGGIWDIYELLPAFIFSCLCIVVVSLLSAKPSEEIEREFEEVQMMGRK